MLKAQKANRVLRIPDERMKDYKAMGYTITDMSGKVISKPDNPADKVKELEKLLEEKDKRIAELEAQLGIDPDNEASEADEDASGETETTDDQGEAETADNEASEAKEKAPAKKSSAAKKATSKK